MLNQMQAKQADSTNSLQIESAHDECFQIYCFSWPQFRQIARFVHHHFQLLGHVDRQSIPMKFNQKQN